MTTIITRRAAPLRPLLLSLLVLVAADLLLAQVARRLWAPWAGQESQARIRVSMPPYHHDLGRELDVVTTWGPHRYRLRTNSLGFKDASTRQVPLSDARYRLLLIGDSFTEGVGLPYETTFAGRIAAELEPRGVEVLNAGVVSYSPTIYYRKTRFLLEDVGLTFDHVVVFLDISDIQDEAVFYDLDDQGQVTFDLEAAPRWAHDLFRFLDPDASREAEPRGRRWKKFLRNNSLAMRLASEFRRGNLGLRRGQDETLPRTGLDRALWTVDDELFETYGRRGLRRAAERMDQLHQLLRSRGLAMTIVVYPWPDQVLRDSPSSRQVRVWRDWAEPRGVGFVDLFAPFFGEGETAEAVLSRYYLPGDVHVNAAGSRLIAESFLEGFAPELKVRLRDHEARAGHHPHPSDEPARP